MNGLGGPVSLTQRTGATLTMRIIDRHASFYACLSPGALACALAAPVAAQDKTPPAPAAAPAAATVIAQNDQPAPKRKKRRKVRANAPPAAAAPMALPACPARWSSAIRCASPSFAGTISIAIPGRRRPAAPRPAISARRNACARARSNSLGNSSFERREGAPRALQRREACRRIAPGRQKRA